MVSWETLVEGASMPPLVLTPIQSGQDLHDCVYNARLVFARTFSLWKHHKLILVPRSTPGKPYWTLGIAGPALLRFSRLPGTAKLNSAPPQRGDGIRRRGLRRPWRNALVPRVDQGVKERRLLR